MNAASNSDGCRIAMWSGPRNISTAMMRSFENRADAVVWDEPLYGPYLHQTGLPHPMAEQVIAEQGSDWRPVIERIAGPIPGGHTVFYQKHMTHHLLPGMSRGWITEAGLQNCFLIRDPASVLASYAHKRPDNNFDESDLGFKEQAEIFDRVCDATGEIPPVLNSVDILKNPKAMLQALCHSLAIDFSETMLSWPSGRRDSDGVWSEHWYDSVWQSTGFAPYVEKPVQLAEQMRPIADRCYPYFRKLEKNKLNPL